MLRSIETKATTPFEHKETKELTSLVENAAALIKAKGEKVWVDCYWYNPGENLATLKKTFVRKVEFGNEWYVVGSGFYA